MIVPPSKTGNDAITWRGVKNFDRKLQLVEERKSSSFFNQFKTYKHIYAALCFNSIDYSSKSSSSFASHEL